MTLVEVLIAMAIISVGAMGAISAFTYISRSIVANRSATLATNLCQEAIESMKDKDYFEILPTSTASYVSEFPSLPYDEIYYPPEMINIGNSQFTRYTYVERMEADPSGNLTPVPHNSLDTGIKRITITVVFRRGSTNHKVSLTNLASNTSLAANAAFNGYAVSPAGDPVQGAKVFITNNPFFSGTSSADGSYAFSVTPGSYSVRASKSGYYASTVTAGIILNQGNTANINFVLTPIATGSISGIAWVNTGLVISQVVSASNTVRGGLDAAKVDVEYIELFNPTTIQINITDGGATHHVKLDYDNEHGGGSDKNDAAFALTYLSSYVAPGGYYLIASTGSFYILGNLVFADAYYGTANADYIKKNDAGCLRIHNTADTANFDVLGWCDDTTQVPFPYCKVPAGCYETAPIPDTAFSDGLKEGAQYVRISSPLVASDTLGRAYDSGNNTLDFLYQTGASDDKIIYRPHSSADAAQTIITGKPAIGAVVSAGDGLSTSTQAYAMYAASNALNLPYARFDLRSVATGTWNVEISSGDYYLLIETVSVPTADYAAWVPNATTVDAWRLANYYSAVLDDWTLDGTVTGSVKDPNLNPISGITIDVHPADTTVTDLNGNFSIPVAAGTYDVTANPGGALTSYTSETESAVAVSTGQVTAGHDFILSGAGKVSGYVCNSEEANTYPGIIVAAYDVNDNLVLQTITDSNGNFELIGLSTGIHYVEPVLDSIQVSSPTDISTTVTLGTNLFVGTFTIIGAYGTIAGSVTLNGEAIKTGVLLMATTGSINPAAPPQLSTAMLSQAPYYMTSSNADGTYSLLVRTSTASADFNVYGWYTTYAGDVPSTDPQTFSATVTGGQTVNLEAAWP